MILKTAHIYKQPVWPTYEGKEELAALRLHVKGHQRFQ